MTRTRRTDAERCSPSPFGEGMIVRRVANQEWHLRSSQLDEFCSSSGVRLGQWIERGAATVVKQGAHRAVYRIALPSGTYFLKQYRLAGPRAWLQNNIRPCRAFREAAAIRLLMETGIATAECVAVGRTLHGPFSGESFIITRAIDAVTPLDEWLAADSPQRDQVIENLASLMASLHRHGFFHADSHAGNILVQQRSDELRLFLIDLLPLRRVSLTAQQRWSMLAMLATSLVRQTTSVDRELFLAKYAASLGVRDDPGSLGSFCAKQIAARQARADRKWRRGNRQVAIIDTANVSSRGLVEVGRDTLIAWRNAIARGEAASLTQSATLRRVQAGPTARACWETGHALLRRGLPVTKPLLFVEKRGSGTVVSDGAMRCATFVEWVRRSFDSSCRAEHDQTLLGVGRLLRQIDDAAFVASPEALAIATDGRAIIDRPEHVARRSRWSRRRDGSLQKALSVTPEADDRRSLQAGYAGLVAEPSPQSNASRPSTLHTLRNAAAALLLAMMTVIAGCRSLEKPPATAALPAKHSVRSGQLVLISDFKLGKDDPLVKDLIDLREQVVAALQLPEPRQDVVVYMFSNEDAYRRYLDTVHPGLPSRRAYFVGTKSELAVYTYWGERIQEDLRHEYTHGILHSSLASVPLWLDEGLAEYFEVAGPSPGGMNGDYPHQLAVAVANGWRPDIDRLEQVEEFSQLRRLDYQESWAWVHYLLHASPDTRQELLAYLGDLRNSTHPPALSDRISQVQPGYPARFLGYVATLNSSGGAVIRAASAEL